MLDILITPLSDWAFFSSFCLHESRPVAIEIHAPTILFMLVHVQVGDRLPGGIRIIDIDPSEGEEIDILKAENQRAILKKIVSKSNNNVKTSSRSTDTEAPLEKCQGKTSYSRGLGCRCFTLIT